ncbi:hypothetical protein OIE69_01090 [Actinacidiphila glaucinigra]|uniref:hypothetical protein n=1 Tax=Actinacidiphila glaucinigra TaxID=235986 RepID=UPI002DD84BF0|nr:hypothetical protein [Actinacidiphila glaucinigra]WSD57622.1 hypothetical protein OIE69_01090 [Actinacidiphila glaucinigra]
MTPDPETSRTDAALVITATSPTGPPPAWAVLQRRLFDDLDIAWRAFRDRYTEADGRLCHEGTIEDRDGADDFYEAFFNWPALYLLGGADDLLPAVKRHWEGVTAQLTELGLLKDEFERGYDWFHQGEAMLMFYGICAADPADEAFRRRAVRFAEQYLPGSDTGTYDPHARVVRAPHNGAEGPRLGLGPQWDDAFAADQPGMRVYGLPLQDVPGIENWEDLDDPVLAVRMGHAMRDRLGRGDTAVNLAATALAVNAWLYDHDPRFSSWVTEYVDAWRERADACDAMPDNVGLTGTVGEYHSGRWFGGHYGWTWPHGVHSVGAAALVGAISASLVGGDLAPLDLARRPLDQVWEQRRTGLIGEEPASQDHTWKPVLQDDAERPVGLLPTRVGLQGWFDHQPAQVAYWTWLWWFGMQDQDRARLDALRDAAGYDWTAVRAFRGKEEAGHEPPWLAYLAGDNPGYPEAALRLALGQVSRRMALIAADDTPPEKTDLHHWQRLNPVVTEILTQLTTGAPQTIYNGGLPLARLRWSDLDSRRPGLPADVAALVEYIGPDSATVRLVNLGVLRTRRLGLLAGTFGEHLITAVHWSAAEAADSYPGDPHDYRIPAPPRTDHSLDVQSNRIDIVLPPGREIRLVLDMRLNALTPTHHRLPSPTHTSRSHL